MESASPALMALMSVIDKTDPKKMAAKKRIEEAQGAAAPTAPKSLPAPAESAAEVHVPREIAPRSAHEPKVVLPKSFAQQVPEVVAPKPFAKVPEVVLPKSFAKVPEVVVPPKSFAKGSSMSGSESMAKAKAKAQASLAAAPILGLASIKQRRDEQEETGGNSEAQEGNDENWGGGWWRNKDQSNWKSSEWKSSEWKSDWKSSEPQAETGANSGAQQFDPSGPWRKSGQEETAADSGTKELDLSALRRKRSAMEMAASSSMQGTAASSSTQESAASSGLPAFDPTKLSPPGEEPSPAMLALMEAMEDMNSDVPIKRKYTKNLDGKKKAAPSTEAPKKKGPPNGMDVAAMQAMLSGADGGMDMSAMAGMPGMSGGMPGGMPGMPGMESTGNAEMDSEQLFKAAELLQMQAAWWEQSASIAQSMPSGLMTFGIEPRGPMDPSIAAGGWKYAPTNDETGKAPPTTDGQPIIATQKVYTGFVTEYDIRKKGGFIECDELRQSMQQDIYVHHKVLAQGRSGIGDMVCFPLHISSRGKLQASSPLVRLATNVGFAHTGVFHPCHIKNDGNVGGEIHCQLVQRFFGCYVKVSRELAQPLMYGRKVGFNFIVDAEAVCYCYAVAMVSDDYAATPGELPGADPDSVMKWVGKV